MKTLSRPSQLQGELLAFWKWLLSFRTQHWKFTDYPICVRENGEPILTENARFRHHRYRASILRWLITGFGDTREQARADLERCFEDQSARRQLQGEPLPRPGRRVPLQFASDARISCFPELSSDFVRRVLGMEWALLTDDSLLGHFHFGDTDTALFDKIKDVYGVDVSSIESGNIAEILERIAEHQRLTR
jgi:hypothetical protein